jgi:hypothetical protein
MKPKADCSGVSAKGISSVPPPGIVHLELEVRLCVFLLGGITEQVLERDREEG